MPEPPPLEEALLQAAASLSGAARTALLDGACAGDAAFRARMEALLAAHFKPDPLPPVSASELKATIKLDVPNLPDETVGQTLGRYKLLERLGEGGFGVVYVAEQVQPVRRRVALKVIKLGMDTKVVVARFEAERQALAMMDHPNIAKVLDAGTTERGRPYFVMELVRGIKITDYCDQNHLTTKDRLGLFIKVCQAIQHAHQKGIIHRDIKPSNILVSLSEDVPVPKVIDFGIAKATEGRLTDATVYTQLHQFMGTPAYMSPEQAEMSSLDIDTRSDIYSLGVLLYELLTGTTPFDASVLMLRGIDGMRQTIRENVPLRPSARFQRRSTDSAELRHELKGDLDWIVMKCLEKDRTRRYETANGLAADLKRHLDSEPVTARPPSAAYRLQKAFHRHKLVFSAVAAIGAALLLGIIATTWQSVRATQAQRAAQEAQANEAVQRRTAEANERQAIAAQANEARLRRQAQADELAARQRAYAADMNVAGQALAENNLGRALDLLNRQRPGPGQQDLRGWEWRYLWQQTRSDASFTLCQQSSGILSLSASADGRWLAVGAQAKGGASVWDLSARQPWVRLGENEEDVRAAFSPVAPLLAFTSRRRSDDGVRHHTLHLWDAVARRMLAQVPLEIDACNGLAISSDGQRLVTSTFSGLTNQITIWSLPAATKLASRFTSALSAGDMATDFATTPDFRLAAFPTQDNRIQLLDLRDGRKLWEVPVTSGFVTALMFSPDGKTLATAEGFNESDIRLWDVATGNEVGRLAGHGAWVNSLVFWPDGKTLASSSADQTLRVWDVASRTCLDVLRGHRFGVWRVVLLPDGKTLASGCKDGTVCIWDTSLRHPRQPRLTLPQQVVHWSFSTNSQSVQTFSAQGRVTRWSGAAFQPSETIMDLGTNYDPAFYFYPLFSEDGRLLANGSANGIIRVWDLANHTLLRALTNTSDIVTPVKFLAQGTRLLTESKTGYLLHEWDLSSGHELQFWPEQRGGEAVLADSREENLFVTFVNDGSLQFWDLDTGRVSETNLNFLGAYASAFSPNGRSFAVASTYGYARVWDSGSWRELATLGGFLSGVDSGAFSPDGLRLATGSGKQQALSLWDTTSWQNVLTLEGQGAGFVHSSFSPDGNVLGSLNSDGDLHLWRAPSWAVINAAEAKEKTQFQQP